MVHRAQIAHYARRAARWGVRAGDVSVDLARIVIQKDHLVQSFRAGRMKIVVNAADDGILGASILSPEGGELVQILSPLMLAGLPYTLLKGAVYIHPTLAEGFFALLDAVEPVD
jgi:pyruvate/2-oxoglutarate dehydrogenase complex dihydrolipoamide dehydrogenase (E3) component